MEIKEAIKNLKCILEIRAFGDEPTEAINMAISALDKQKAKKPRIERVDYDKYGEYCINYYCPCCNRRLVSKDITGWFAGKAVRYCECGQKIDWLIQPQAGGKM